MSPNRPSTHVQPGFTLIETILYTLIISLILASFFLIIQATLTTQAKFKAHALFNENVRFALQKTESRIHEASAISYPPAGTTSTRLTLTMTDASKNPTTFSLENGQLLFREGSASSTNILSKEIYVNEFLVTHTTTTPPSVRITLIAQTINEPGTQGASTTIQETFSLRR